MEFICPAPLVPEPMSYRTRARPVRSTSTPPLAMTVEERTNDVIRLTPVEFNLFKEPRPTRVNCVAAL